MEKVTVSVELPKEAQAFADGLTKFLAQVLINNKDGFQPAADLTADALALYNTMGSAFMQIAQLPKETSEDLMLVLKAFNLAAYDILKLFQQQ